MQEKVNAKPIMVETFDNKNFGERQKSRALLMYEDGLRKQGLDPLKFLSKDELNKV